MNVAVFGCGYIGSRWIKIADSHPDIDTIYAVDINSSVLQDLVEFDINFINMDVLQAEAGTQLQQAQYRVLTECNLWIIGTGYQHHMDIISVADSASVPQVLVEKPVFKSHHIHGSEYPDRIDQMTTQVYTDYIELSNPYFTAVVDQAVADSATITRAFHWRGKDGQESVGIGNKHPYEHPAVKGDLVHDISELYFLMNALGQSDSFTLKQIGETRQWSELTRNGVAPVNYFTDESWANLTYETENGDYTIQGGFTDTLPRRFFVWIDETNDCAYYGDTLSEPYYTEPPPFRTYKLESATAGNELQQTLASGDTEISQFLKSRPGSEITAQKTEHTFEIVLDELASDSPTLPTLHDAYKIEAIAEQFYEQSEYQYGTYH